MFESLLPTSFTFDLISFFIGTVVGILLYAVVLKNKNFRFIFHWGERGKIEVETSSGPDAVSGGEQEDS